VSKVILATLLAGAISLLIAILGQTWLGNRQAASIPLPGRHNSAQDALQHLPTFSLPDLSGQMIASSAWAGQVVILNFWATWCLPCLRALPILDVSQAVSERVRVVGIAIDTQDEVTRYLSKNPVTYPILMGGTDAVEMSRRLGNRLQGLPFTVIFDSQGRRTHGFNGEFTQGALGEKLAPLLARAIPPPLLAN
jgi:thiol-disulfide isomerase/thioredoxin